MKENNDLTKRVMNLKNQLCIKLIHCGNININCPEDWGQKNIFFMPMGLFSLANVLAKYGVDVEIIHLDFEKERNIDKILDLNTLDAIGFDMHWVNQSAVVLDTAKAIKNIKPDIFIFLGGYTASLFTEEIVLNYSQIDGIIKGDGEVPIVELCQALNDCLLAGKTLRKENLIDLLKGVQNFVFWGNQREIFVNEITYTAKVDDMEKLSFSDVKLLRNWKSYRSASLFYSHFEPISLEPMFLLEVGRGCQYSCKFCGGNNLAQRMISNRNRTIFRSVDSVMDTIKEAFSFGFRTFYTCLESEESEEWYINLIRKIGSENLAINYVHGCWKLPSKTLIDVVSENCTQSVFEISPETSDETLRKRNKGLQIAFKNEQLEECLDYISKKKNIKVQLFFGYYLAGDTETTVLSTIYFIINLLMKYPDMLEIEYANFSTDPGSLFFLYPQKYEIDIKVRNFGDYIKALTENYKKQSGQAPDMMLFIPKGMSAEVDTGIRRKVGFFNFLFSAYRKTMSYILNISQNPGIVLNMIKNAKIYPVSHNTFPVGETTNFLYESCKEENILDMYLKNLIHFETKEQESGLYMSKPTVQLYLSNDYNDYVDVMRRKSLGNFNCDFDFF